MGEDFIEILRIISKRWAGEREEKPKSRPFHKKRYS